MIDFSQSEHIVTIVSRDECLPLVALPPHPPPVIKADGQNALWTRQATSAVYVELVALLHFCVRFFFVTMYVCCTNSVKQDQIF